MNPALWLILFGHHHATTDADMTWYNVKTTYGARGNTRKVTDAVLSNGSTAVASATGAFTSADIGKAIFGVEISSGAAKLPVGTILLVNSPTSITVSVAATGDYTGVHLVFGTDDSNAIRAARVAADAANPKGKVYLPAGGYLFSKLLFDLQYSATTDTIAVEGDGADCTYLFMHPNYDFATTQDNASAIFRFANAQFFRGGGFTLDCSYYAFTWNNVYPFVAASHKAFYSDIRVLNIRGARAPAAVTIGLAYFQKCWFAQSAACSYGLFVDLVQAIFEDCYTGSHSGTSSLRLNGIDGDSNQTYYFRWQGGLIDESGTASVDVVNSTDVSFIGAKIVSGDGVDAMTVDGTSKVRLTNSELTPYSASGNRGGLNVLAGGVATLGESRLDSCGTGFGLTNAGTVIDGGGNTINKISGSTPVARFGIAGNAQAFDIKTLTELTTIAAAATTDTTIQIPANAVVLGVSTRVTTVIPTAATYTVGVSGATARYATGISTAAGTTDPGTLDAARYYAAAVSIRITPNAQPAANTGRLRVTIHYYTITPPTS